MQIKAEVSEEDDPVVSQFLGLLARDIVEHPERLQAIDASLVTRIRSLVGDIEVDLNEPLAPDEK
jgi:antitoxin PrlF